MEEWLFTDACDGFNVMFPYVPGGLDDFVIWLSLNFNAAGCSARSTKVEHYGRISDCRDLPIGSFRMHEAG